MAARVVVISGSAAGDRPELGAELVVRFPDGRDGRAVEPGAQAAVLGIVVPSLNSLGQLDNFGQHQWRLQP